MKDEYNAWEAQFSKQINIALKASDEAFNKSCDVLYNNIKIRTPVGDPSLWKYPAKPGYVPGTLKSSWNIYKNQNTVKIDNNQPYAERVEFGWSTQAPYGMVRISLKEFPSIVATASKEFKV